MIIILILSFLLKIFWIHYIECWPTMDAENYLRTAKNIYEGNFPDIYWPVGYSFFLSAFYYFESILLLKILNAFLATLTTFFLIKISEIYYKNYSIITIIVLAFFPEFIFYCSTLWSETFFLFLLTASIYFQLRERYYLSGLFYSLQFFVRPVSVFLPFLIRFAIQRKFQSESNFLFVRILIPIFLLHFTWSLFVYNKTGSWVFVSTNGSVNLLIGNNPEASGHYDEDGLRFVAQQGIETQDYARYVINYWLLNYYELPILFTKKIYFAIFGEGRAFKASSSLAIHHLSTIPKKLTKEQYNRIYTKIQEKDLLKIGYEFTNDHFHLNKRLTDMQM